MKLQQEKLDEVRLHHISSDGRKSAPDDERDIYIELGERSSAYRKLSSAIKHNRNNKILLSFNNYALYSLHGYYMRVQGTSYAMLLLCCALP